MSDLMQIVQLGNRGVGLADILSAARFVEIKLRNSLSMVNLVSLQIRKSGVTAKRGPEKVERGRRYGSAKAKRGHRWNTRKRSSVLNFYLYRTRISSYI